MNMWMRNAGVRANTWIVLALVVSGCAAAQTWNAVPLGRIGTEGVSLYEDLADAEPSFRLTWEDDTWTPPFYADNCVVRATPENYDIALENGARRVRVVVPGREAPLFGVLALCRTHPDARGPATRMYLIQVPAARVAATAGGRISVVFEPTNHQQSYADGRHAFDAWQLWLSEVPFR